MTDDLIPPAARQSQSHPPTEAGPKHEPVPSVRDLSRRGAEVLQANKVIVHGLQAANAALAALEMAEKLLQQMREIAGAAKPMEAGGQSRTLVEQYDTLRRQLTAIAASQSGALGEAILRISLTSLRDADLDDLDQALSAIRSATAGYRAHFPRLRARHPLKGV